MEPIEEIRPGLSSEQLAVIKSPAKFLRVIAGPGSGKTLTLTHRLISIYYDYKLSPEDVTAITFTRHAATELQERVAKSLLANRMLRAGGLSNDPSELTQAAMRESARMHISTVHSWCLGFLRDHGAALGLRSNFTVLDDIDRTDIRGVIRSKYGEANLEELYWQHKMGINALDYDDLLTLTLRIFDEFPEVKERVHVRWLFWDEFQDSCGADYRLLRHMNPIACTIVGDPDQAIYGFRGSSSAFMARFAEDYPEVQTLQLSVSYRSCAPIMLAAGNLIGCEEGRLVEKPMRGVNVPPSGFGGLAALAAPRAEIPWTDSAFLQLTTPGVDPRSTAILVRTNHQIAELVERAKQLGLDLDALKPPDILWKDPGARLLLKALQHLDNPDNSWPLEWLVREGFFDIEAQAWEEIKLGAVKMGATVWEVARALPLFAPLRELIDELPFSPDRPAGDDILAIVRKLDPEQFWLRRFQLTRVDAQKLFLDYFLPKWHTIQLAHARPIHRRSLLSWSALREAQDDNGSAQTAPVVATIHAAKGLEWRAVIIAPFFEGYIPHPKAPLDEERRLLYVAITRAREVALFVGPHDGRVSRFANEIWPSELVPGVSSKASDILELLRAKLEGNR